MRIKITKGGIFGAVTDENPTGEIPVGTEFTVKEEPTGWAGRYEVISGGKDDDKKTAVTNETKIKAEHHGGGKFNITQGETVLASGLSKADADAFNNMSDEDKAAYVAETKKD